MTDVTTVPMSRAEDIMLVNLEQVITDGMETFVHVGQALRAIQAGDLYRGTHSTFAAYVKDRFGLGKSQAYRQMDAAEVAAIVSPIGDIRNEAQARELVGLEPDQAREVYQKVIADTAGKPTAAAIATARKTVVPERTKAKRRPLPMAYKATVWELDRVVNRLRRLQDDDRFAGHRQELADRCYGDLKRLRLELEELEAELESEKKLW